MLTSYHRRDAGGYTLTPRKGLCRPLPKPLGKPVSGGPFVQVRPEAWRDLTQQHRLSQQAERVLLSLVLAADYRTWALSSFTLTDFAEFLGLGAQSGRRTVSKALKELDAAELIAYTPAKGSAAGSVKVLCYGVVVHNATEPTEAQVCAKRAARRTPSARPSRDFAAIDRTDKQTPLPPTAAEAAVALEEPRGAAPPSNPPSRQQHREVNQRPLPRQRRRSSRTLGTNPRAVAERAAAQAAEEQRRQKQLVAASAYGHRMASAGLLSPEEFPTFALDAAQRAGWPPEVTAAALDAFDAELGARTG